MSNSENGRKFVMIISGYMVVKAVINLILGFGLGNIITLLVTFALCYFMFKGQQYMNYITAGVLALVMLYHLKGNIEGRHFFYLLEGIIDIAAAVVLVINKDIKAYFND
ncbi:MAG: hypothetical protein ACI4I6_09330 [Hominimerdicola sp.]